MPVQNPTPTLTVPDTADEAELWRLGGRLEINQPGVRGVFRLMVLIAAPAHLASKYAYIGLIQGLTDESRVALALILPPSEPGGGMELRFRPAHPIVDREVAELLHRDHISQTVRARESRVGLAERKDQTSSASASQPMEAPHEDRRGGR